MPHRPSFSSVEIAHHLPKDDPERSSELKGEPSEPEDHSQGEVWQSILKHIDTAGVQDEFTSATDVLRSTFESHPWSIGGGGAADLKEQLEAAQSQPLSELVKSIGFYQDTHADEVFVQPSDFCSATTSLAC